MMQTADPRSRYLKIAARRFAAEGFHGVSLAKLADEAGVTKQALLHFFSTKERLYAEVLSRLAERLLTKLNAAEGARAEDRLIVYFEAHAAGAFTDPADSRLVVRALLDSDASARIWPMKPYLDRLVAIVRETARWRDATPEEALAGAYHLIGALQYAAISAPTLTGMHGEAAQRAFSAYFSAHFREAVRRFVAASTD